MKTAQHLALLAIAACATLAARAQTDHGLKRPAWFENEPIVMVCNPDEFAGFMIRRGVDPIAWHDQYVKDSTEETAQYLHDKGATLALLHFYKGFGLQAEAEHIADSKRFAGLLKKQGIRIGVYIGSTVFYETFFAEKPEAQDWFVPDYQGRKVTYDGGQYFRRRVYFMHPGYRAYMKEVVRVAVQDFGADLLHFDNTSEQAEDVIFYHPLAIADFRDYLRKKFTPEQLKERFGFSETRFIQPPELGGRPGGRSASIINDPVAQEWAEFRIHQLNAYYREMTDYARSLNPNVAVDSNPSDGMSGHNTVWEEGVDYPSHYGQIDVAWSEERDVAGVGPSGILVSKIRTYKMATSLDSEIFTPTAGVRGGGKLSLAEAMAFNRQSLGTIGNIGEIPQLSRDQLNYIKFFRDNFADYKRVGHLADIAVLHSHSSMGYDSDLPWQSTFLYEQALIEARIPFTLIFDDQLADLSKFKAIVLADQESLSDAQIAQIRKYVEGGGGLVATENTSYFDSWRRRRNDYGLRDLFGAEAPPPVVGTERDPAPPATSSSTTHRTVGSGRVAYISAVVAALPKPAGVPMTNAYWKLPRNASALVKEVRWAARAPLSVEVDGPGALVMELTQLESGDLALHLLNYNTAKDSTIKNIDVSLAIPSGKTVGGVRLISPDHAERKLDYLTLGDRLKFTDPQLNTYDIALVHFQ